MPFLSLLLYRQNVSSNPLAFFKIFFFFNLSCLVFSSCLHLWFDVMNLRKYCIITVTKISSIPFYELSSGFPITCSFTFCDCPTVFIYSVLFFFQYVFSLLFSVGSFYGNIIKLRKIFLSHVQCFNKGTKGLLPSKALSLIFSVFEL